MKRRYQQMNNCENCFCDVLNDDLEDSEAYCGPPIIGGAVALTQDMTLPKKGSSEAAGYDLVAAHDFLLKPGMTTFVGTGVFLELPQNTRAMVYPRSGFSTKHGVIIPNAPGLIDSDYTGEVKVALHMLWTPRKMFTVYKGKRGDRIAQLVFGLTFDWQPTIKTLENFRNTSRGSGGFGSTGK
jgi:dUTP pyrophosphatase